MEQMILNAVSSVGIPAAIAFFLLLRVTKSLDELTKVVTILNERLAPLVRSGDQN